MLIHPIAIPQDFRCSSSGSRLFPGRTRNQAFWNPTSPILLAPWTFAVGERWDTLGGRRVHGHLVFMEPFYYGNQWLSEITDFCDPLMHLWHSSSWFLLDLLNKQTYRLFYKKLSIRDFIAASLLKVCAHVVLLARIECVKNASNYGAITIEIMPALSTVKNIRVCLDGVYFSRAYFENTQRKWKNWRPLLWRFQPAMWSDIFNAQKKHVCTYP